MTSFQSNSAHNHGASNNSNNNNHEYSKKEEFRRYLEKSGVLDALTKVFVGLYEEPERHTVNPLEYVKKYLGAPAGVDLEGLKRENDELRKQVDKLKKQLQLQQQQQQTSNVSTVVVDDKKQQPSKVAGASNFAI